MTSIAQYIGVFVLIMLVCAGILAIAGAPQLMVILGGAAGGTVVILAHAIHEEDRDGR